MTGTSTPTHEVASDRHEEPVELLRDLIRFDTTNPPGDERACIQWIAELLDAYEIEYETYAADPDRPILVGRIEGGEAAPLLLYGHVDVVPAEGDWTHPPFDGVLEDGYVWGRGALDMKGGVAMFLAAFLRVAAEELQPAGDLLLCVVPDEEAGGDEGLGYMVEEHAEAFEGVEYALGEFGGFSLHAAGERFYPIQVNEKQICWLEATFHGDGGHGALPRTDDATARMARFIDALDGTRLPVHSVPAAEEMVGQMADALPLPTSLFIRALHRPWLTDHVLDLLGEDGELFDALTHNVVNETIVRGGTKENVVPESVSLTLDCRLLPGQTPEDVIAELEAAVGDVAEHVTFEVIRYEAGPSAPDMGFVETLGGVIEAADPDGRAIPLLLPAVTDGRHLAKLGIQSYGFTPMNLPDDFAFMEVIHAPDERIPAGCLDWGTERVVEAIRRYDG